MPALEIAAPFAFVANPSVIVRPLRVFVVPLFIVNTRTRLFPLIVSRLEPGPVIEMLAASAGKAEANVTVPVVFKKIISPPPLALASRIASRREPAPESKVLVTENVAAVTLMQERHTQTNVITRCQSLKLDALIKNRVSVLRINLRSF